MTLLHSLLLRPPFFNLRSQLCFGLCLYFFLHPLFAAEQDATQQELNAVNSAIEEISAWLESANARQSAAQQSLREAEIEISELSQTMAQLGVDITNGRQRLSNLQQQQRDLESEREASEAIIEQLLAAAYVRGESGAIQTLLNQEDSSESDRMLHYTRVFGNYQLTEIEKFQTTIDALTDVANEIGSELSTLENQQKQLADTNEKLEFRLGERTQALTALTNDIANRNAELEQLEFDQAELQALLEEIARAMSGIRSFADVPPLEPAKGELPRPVEGPILSRFGTTYGGGSLTRQGIFIGATEGTPVTAVHPGYVAFASWLQGQGLLVVLDHGEGFVTLYGGNQALAVEAGQWVARDEVIATSGTSANGDASGLYFELRQEGEAQNPSQWLTSP